MNCSRKKLQRMFTGDFFCGNHLSSVDWKDNSDVFEYSLRMGLTDSELVVDVFMFCSLRKLFDNIPLLTFNNFHKYGEKTLLLVISGHLYLVQF